MGISELRKESCGLLPTPLHRLDRLSGELGCGIYIKRDDLTGLGFNGNKIRKLEFLVREALDQGATALVTFGGPQTNHGRQTAAVACKFGMKCVIIATMGEEGPNERLSGNLLLDAIFGAEVVFLDTSSVPREGRSPDDVRADVRELQRRAGEQIADELTARGERPYVMPTGGSTELGCMGYLFAVREIMDQLDAMGVKIDRLVCPSGSNGTFGGLWLGARYFGAPFEVIGSCVSPHDPVYSVGMAEFINRASERYGLGIKASPEDIHVLSAEYAGPGYDVPDDMTYSTIYRLARTEGILVDPCYTGKGFTAVIKEIERGAIPKGSSVLFVHTGGLPGLWSEQHLAKFSSDLWEGREHRVLAIK